MEKMTLALLSGGVSSEREVSLNTGAAVLEALQKRGIDAHAWDPAEKSMAAFAAAEFDRVWIALHGPGGEDGALQGLLQWLEIPYTGSGVMASAIAMDKVRSKHLFRAAGIPTPDYSVVTSVEEASVAAEQVGFPLIIKPSGPTVRKVIDDTVGIVDIVPTILSQVGAPDLAYGQGIDLTPFTVERASLGAIL